MTRNANKPVNLRPETAFTPMGGHLTLGGIHGERLINVTLGVLLGVVIGMMLDNIGMGIGIGIGLAIAIALSLAGRKSTDRE